MIRRQILTTACIALQLGWQETEEGLLIVSEPLFFPRVSESSTCMHALLILCLHVDLLS